MKKVLSVSLGSSHRDGESVLKLGREEVLVCRRGTDGDKQKARTLFLVNDGKYDAFGLGGTDLSVRIGQKQYYFRESLQLVQGLKTPVLDGGGLKNSLERRLVQNLAAKGELQWKKVLLLCATDRFGMAEALAEQKISTVYGDLLFGVGLNLPLYSLSTLEKWISFLAPLYSRLPISMLYPVGKSQRQRCPRGEKYFAWADFVAGDFHYLYKYMPEQLPGKVVITNTVTAADREFLRQAGVKKLLTSTPNLQGRSYGTNVLEAALVAFRGAKGELPEREYLDLLDRYQIGPAEEIW